MRVVLDTNVLISGIFWNGPPFEILRHWREGDVTFIVSPEIINEYYRVGEELAQKHTEIEVESILDLIVTSSEICLPAPLPRQVCRDADDDKFIACALTTNVNYIVSGDKRLLEISGYQGIKVVRPKDFLNFIP